MNPYLLTALIILGVLLLFFAITFIFTYLVFKKSYGRSNKTPDVSAGIYAELKDKMQVAFNWFESMNPEKITITSFDGLNLYARLLVNPEVKATIILMHGWHGNSKYDFSLVLDFFYKKGLNVLLVDQRAHGESEGDYLTFGTKESVDCLYWAKYIANRFKNLPIDLHGISMGGATVMMTLRFEDLPKEVKCVTSDCCFTSPDKIVANVRKLMHLPSFPFQYYIRFISKHVAKFDMQEVDTTKILCNNRLPLLLIHGKADTFIPPEMSIENYNVSASVSKSILLVDDAGHGLSYVKDPKKVEDALEKFINKHLLNG